MTTSAVLRGIADAGITYDVAFKYKSEGSEGSQVAGQGDAQAGWRQSTTSCLCTAEMAMGHGLPTQTEIIVRACTLDNANTSGTYEAR